MQIVYIKFVPFNAKLRNATKHKLQKTRYVFLLKVENYEIEANQFCNFSLVNEATVFEDQKLALFDPTFCKFAVIFI